MTELPKVSIRMSFGLWTACCDCAWIFRSASRQLVDQQAIEHRAKCRRKRCPGSA